jgi:UDP-N-acetylmuramyl pentapeptide phosphotransferase/UDP-N-acetylglucosamine-1-phosphate transferase
MAAYLDANPLLVIAGIPIMAAALCAGVLVLLLPLLRSRALAHPVDRSLHRVPTPQGGGVGVILATMLTAWIAVVILESATREMLAQLSILTAAAALLALVGLADDVFGLSPTPRLIAQSLAVGLILVMLPTEMHVVPTLPLWIERLVLAVAGVWFVNLVNFMDGIDWMTVAETVPITAAVAMLGMPGSTLSLSGIVALALLGAIIGFAPFNRPVARLFLGDVGSLPIGLVLGWLLLLLVMQGHFAAALLLPLYYLADATITLALRAYRREPVWLAHRSHFYQRAVGGGLSVPKIIARVFATNAALAALALISIAASSTLASLLCLMGGAVLVGFLLVHFSNVRP